MHDWQLFKFAITNRSLYILGAGASFPTIPFNPSDQLRQNVESNGCYETNLQPVSLLKQRLLPYDQKLDIEALKSGSISPNALVKLIPMSVIEVWFSQIITAPLAKRT